MIEIVSLIGISTALCVGAVSPGPSFLMVARTAASFGRKSGLSAALGMGLGALIFAIASLLGLNAIFEAVPVLYLVLKLVGGLYLAYLGFCIFKGAIRPLEASAALSCDSGRGHSYQLLLGLTTQISNPKTAVIYASVFATFLPAAPSMEFNALVAFLAFAIESGWYAIVAMVLSSERPRARYLQFKKRIDRSAGAILGALGIRLATSAAH